MSLSVRASLLFLVCSIAVCLISAQNVQWTIDTAAPWRSVSVDLWGIFFEEINHAGVGGLYTQQIMNGNFETTKKTVDPWVAVPSSGVRYSLTLDQTMPLVPQNPTSLKVTTTASGSMPSAGISNPGFWGINTNGQKSFSVSFYAYSSTITSVTVSLTNADGSESYGKATVSGITSRWQQFTTTLNIASSTDPKAVFTVSWMTMNNMDTINFDVFNVMPSEGWMGLQFIRPDLANLVAALHPSFVRFPGGCYVEGDILVDRFNWKHAIGALENRTGHWDLWNYYSEDGLGLFEYLSFTEKLTDAYGNPTRNIWVVNNGISHEQSVPPDQLASYVQDALDSVEFAQGDVSTRWGSLRAAMGHSAPFHIDYFAIGNEDCGKDYYWQNYQLFYYNLTAKYPHIKLISNCYDRTQPIQSYDYHIYTSSSDFIAQQHVFDTYGTRETIKVFNSEYAVTTPNTDWYTTNAAVGEAAWMTGLERNSDMVVAASYAPLFVNDNDHKWDPNAIVFNSAQSYGSPSYYNQLIWSNAFNGIVSGSVQTVNYTTNTGNSLALSVTVGKLVTPANTMVYVHKLVNTAGNAQSVSIRLNNIPSSSKLNPTVDVITLGSSRANAKNSFDTPMAVAPKSSTMSISSSSFDVTVPQYSVVVLRVYVTTSGSQLDQF